MSGRLRNTVAGCLALAIAPLAFCGPMGLKDSAMAMGDFIPNWQEIFSNYALTPRDALGASTLYMRSDDESKSRQLADATYTRLVHTPSPPLPPNRLTPMLPISSRSRSAMVFIGPSMA